MTAGRAPKAVADVSSGLILASVDIDVPPERVFKALASEEIVEWWGDSATYHAKAWSADVRVGGAWRVEGEAVNGVPYHVEGRYEVVDPPHRLVQTWKTSWEPGPATRLTYLLERTPTGTRLTVRHEGFGDRRDACAGHAQGWERVMSWLVTHLERAS